MPYPAAYAVAWYWWHSGGILHSIDMLVCIQPTCTLHLHAYTEHALRLRSCMF